MISKVTSFHDAHCLRGTILNVPFYFLHMSSHINPNINFIRWSPKQQNMSRENFFKITKPWTQPLNSELIKKINFFMYYLDEPYCILSIQKPCSLTFLKNFLLKTTISTQNANNKLTLINLWYYWISTTNYNEIILK